MQKRGKRALMFDLPPLKSCSFSTTGNALHFRVCPQMFISICIATEVTHEEYMLTIPSPATWNSSAFLETGIAFQNHFCRFHVLWADFHHACNQCTNQQLLISLPFKDQTWLGFLPHANPIDCPIFVCVYCKDEKIFSTPIPLLFLSFALPCISLALEFHFNQSLTRRIPQINSGTKECKVSCNVIFLFLIVGY